MPATIACPKCQTRYKLPDSALGKPIKCQKCGASFRTQKPGAPSPAAAAAKPQPSQQEMAKFGIEGPMKRQADIFSAPPPQRGGSLGNFALEDPGFADIDLARQEVRDEEGADDGMQSIIANPYASRNSSGGKGGRKPGASDIDLRDYGVARIGMWLVLVAWSTMLGIMPLTYVFGWIVRLAPDFVRSVVETVGPGVVSAIAYTILGLMSLSLGVVFIGQIVCIFAPNKNERLFAGLAVGALVCAVVIPIVGIFIGAIGAGVLGLGGDADADSSARGAAAIAMGFMFVVIIFVSYLLALSNMFFFITYFRRIGKNIRSKQVAQSAKLAMKAMITALVVGISCGIAVSTLLGMFSEPPEWFSLVSDLVQLVNVGLGFFVLGTLIAMAKTTLAKTKPV